MYSLLLLPLGTVQPLLSHLLVLLEQLNDFNRLLPDTGPLEEQELQTDAQKTSSGQWDCFQTVKKITERNILNSSCSDCGFFSADKNEDPVDPRQQQEEECMWAWLLDLERSVALAAGRCLGGMLQGPAASLQEKTSEYWLSNILFRNGLEMDFEQLGRKT